MKLTILSNCQGESLLACLKAMRPDIEIDFCIVSRLWNGSESILNIFENSDHVMTQLDIYETLSAELKAKALPFPRIVYPAFHPDMTYLRGIKKGSSAVETIYTPMLHYNSKLIVHSFIRNKDSKEALEMFNEQNFKKLGYLAAAKRSAADLHGEFNRCGFDYANVDTLIKSGDCFMHSFNHPDLRIMRELAAQLLHKLGLDSTYRNVDRYANDPLKEQPIWPIYPEIAQQFGMQGDYAFKLNSPNGVITLEQYISYCYEIYSGYELDSIEPLNFSLTEFDSMLKARATVRGENPYKGLPDHHFWKRAVASADSGTLDPMGKSRFRIGKQNKVATAGSCFAQHIAKTLSRSGFNYYVPESAPENMSIELANELCYGVFSARYGNVYTARQLLQLMQRCYGQYSPVDDIWQRKDGRYVDAFRPQVEPNGFISKEEVAASRTSHLQAVRHMFETLDTFVFTLGLTEAWVSSIDGAVYPLAPGVSGGEMSAEKYRFKNFGFAEILSDMKMFIDLLKLKNPNCKILLTVSPVPLLATYENEHVLVATTYSKSVLRVVVKELRDVYDFVEYFPSYEIITGNFNRGRYFDEDLRTVKPEGVEHVMNVFMKNLAGDAAATSDEVELNTNTAKSAFDIVCDEEAIARF